MNNTKMSKLIQIFACSTLLLGTFTVFATSSYGQTSSVSDELSGFLPSDEKPIGGPGGKPFKENIPLNAVRVVALNVWGGQYIDAIQFVWQDADGTTIEGKKWGGSKGVRCIQLEVNKDQYIKSISGRYGDNLDNLVVERSDGYKVSCGGTGGGKSFAFTAPEDRAIFGVFGRSGDLIDALGVILFDLPKPIPEVLPNRLPNRLQPLPPNPLLKPR